MSGELRNKLAQVEGRIRELRDERPAKVKALEEAKEAYSNAPEGEDEAYHSRAVAAYRELGEIDDALAAEQRRQVELLKLLGDREEVAQGATPNGQRSGGGSWSAAGLLANAELRSRLAGVAASKSRFGAIELGQVADRGVLLRDLGGAVHADDVPDVDLGDAPRMRESAYQGVVPQLQRPLTLLDLIPTGTTDGNLVPYTQEFGSLDGAEEVAEGSLKPQITMSFEDADAPVRTIAAFLKLRKQALADFAALQSIMDTRLRYIVQRRLEGQIVNGTGAGDTLKGILNTSGIGKVEHEALPVTELLLKGVTNVYLSEGVANAVVVHPLDWQAALTERAKSADGTTGAYTYIGGGPFGVTPQTVWGVPIIPSVTVAQGTALVGDFALGSTLLIREGVNVLVSDSDQDDFVKNRVTMLGEMRAALLVWRPPVFQEVELTEGS